MYSEDCALAEFVTIYLASKIVAHPFEVMGPTEMASNTKHFSIQKLAADGVNWVTWKGLQHATARA
jgi:hypothetical protein